MIVRRLLPAVGLALGFAVLVAETRSQHSAPGQVAKPRWHTLGRLDAEATGEALSLAGDVVIGHAGRTFVLDVFARRILAFGPDGRFQSSFGAPGRGPGELAAPVALAADGRGSIFVLDPGNRRIEAYSGTAEKPVRLRALALDFQADDLCAIGTRLYVLGARRGYVLHEVSPADGSVLRSFAPDPDAADPVMGSHSATGYIDCDPAGQITLLPLIRPEVRRFAAGDGALLGQMTLPGYSAAVVKRLPDGAMLFQEPEDTRSEAAGSIVTLPGGRQLVQVGVLVPGGATRHEFESLRSLLLSWRDGTISELGENLPRMLATDGQSLFSVQTEPEPAVRRIAVDFETETD